MSTEIIIALISAVIPILGNILLELMRNNKSEAQHSQKIGVLLPQGVNVLAKKKKRNWIITILIALVFAIAGYVISRIVFPPSGSSSTPVSTDSQNDPNGVINTPIPHGPLLLDMSFTEVGDGSCDKYDAKILGYEFHKYYIQPLSPQGYISACKTGDWGPKVSLEVEAYPEGDLSFFGYAVIVGWQGNSSGTTDACVFGVKRTVGAQTASEAFVKQRIDGIEKTLDRKVLPFSLDNNPHNIRVVFLTDSLAVGYIDNQFVGEFEFDHCSKGQIGLIAWGTGETKIYFDNFRLSSLP